MSAYQMTRATYEDLGKVLAGLKIIRAQCGPALPKHIADRYTASTNLMENAMKKILKETEVSHAK